MRTFIASIGEPKELQETYEPSVAFGLESALRPGYRSRSHRTLEADLALRLQRKCARRFAFDPHGIENSSGFISSSNIHR